MELFHQGFIAILRHFCLEFAFNLEIACSFYLDFAIFLHFLSKFCVDFLNFPLGDAEKSVCDNRIADLLSIGRFKHCNC